MRVMIIPEDPTHDQHVVKPIVDRIFAGIGRRARVEVLRDPHLRGIDQALDRSTVAGIIEDHPMMDLFVLVVDRDCDRQRNTRRATALAQEHHGRLLVTLAREEVEVWALALHRDRLGAPWSEVRAHCDPKERFFDPFVRQMGWLETVGRGRKRAMRELRGSWRGLLTVCPEIAELQDAIQDWLPDG